MTADLFDKFMSFTRENALISLPSAMVVGVSGGADSMTLLHVLSCLRERGLTVYAVHIHHGLRGEEADRDERLVRDFCAQLGVSLTVERADVRALAAMWNCGLEEAGRRVRYDVFERVRQAVGAQFIATAHTADDATETVLMHMVRGCGVGGLVGIPPRRGAIVRPLLSCTRAEIEAYCAAQDIPFAVDSTNDDIAFMRNRVRHELLPLMRQMNPSIDEALARLRAAASGDEAYFDVLATAVFDEARGEDGSFSRMVFLRQPLAVRVRLWKLLLAHFGCFSFTERHIAALETALRNNRGTVCVSADCGVTVSADRIERLHSGTSFCALSVCSLPFSFDLDGQTHELRLFSCEEMAIYQNVHKKFFNYAVDYDKIQGGLCVRSRLEGDYLHLPQRRVGKSLKKVFQEYRIPAHRRDIYPLLCDNDGLALVPGIGCDTRVCPDADTKHFLVWTVNGKPCYTVWYALSAGCAVTESKE